MKSDTMPKTYNPKDFEDRIYQFWLRGGYFQPSDGEEGKQPFVIVIPPPNVTGVLHMGHGLNNILQDTIIRFQRMLKKPTLWLPGTDHAGIATQNVVERRLKARGLSRTQLGREAFIEETWKVKHEHHTVITRQLQKLGASCDWDRERFTLDEGCSRAVREVFVGLYERGLIYRGNYLVNWCPSCGTALSDDEVDHEEVQGALYHFRYPFTDGDGGIEIATTRPETLLGDTAVAVHPEDERYKALVGRQVHLPLTGRIIPIIADSYVDREFGTGAVKITPGHDSNDWAVAERHGLEKINILTPEGNLNDRVPEVYQNLDVLTARKRVVEDMKAGGWYLREEKHVHQIGHCYRCHSRIEPYMSEQWFVRMKPLADKALAAWERDEVEFFPRKWENTYTHWLKNIRDWCISRQLWWGHRIPVWYCDDCGAMTVRRDDPEVCEACGSSRIRQDEDVLDTWFSSWLWPFSTLGWPDKTEDLKRFFPTSTLVTGYDIIFFWVARMIMASLEFMGQVPFHDIYITGLVRDKQGRKMSKSLGNGMDPLEVVDSYGADAMKFTLTFMSAQGQDILIDMDSFKLGSRFANKVWNASRYILMNRGDSKPIPLEKIEKTKLDTWILGRLSRAAEEVRKAMESYRFNDASTAVYDFFWNDFCDWYIEASKMSLYSQDPSEKDRAVAMLTHLLSESCKLLHPFLSFITEEIYSLLHGPEVCCMVQEYPSRQPSYEDEAIDSAFKTLQDIVRGIRTLRSEFTLPPEKKVPVILVWSHDFSADGFLREQLPLIRQLAGLSEGDIRNNRPTEKGYMPVPGTGWEAYVGIREALDLEAERLRMTREAEKMRKLADTSGKKLSNQGFLAGAPEDVVAKEKEKLAEFEERYNKLQRYIKELGE
ncbi:MAG: valine--tRNA ligase [Spirochaetales bacterium]|nr:valine--tRNA ligase [Spirochaetales bacterium]